MPLADQSFMKPSTVTPELGDYTCKMLKILGHNLILVEITSGPQKGIRHLAKLPAMFLRVSKYGCYLQPGQKPRAKLNKKPVQPLENVSKF